MLFAPPMSGGAGTLEVIVDMGKATDDTGERSTPVGMKPKVGDIIQVAFEEPQDMWCR